MSCEVAVGAGHIDDHSRQPRRHGNRHLQCPGHLDFSAAAGGVAGEPVQQHVGQGHVGQPGLAFIVGDVTGRIAVKLQQAHHLPGAGQGRARDIGRPEIAPHVGAAGTGAGIGGGGGQLVQGRGVQTRARQRIVVQPADAQDRHRQVQRRLGLRRIERPRFRRVLIDAQGQVEGFLDVRHRAADIQQGAIGVRAAHRQAVGLRKGDDRLVILFRRAEPGGKLFRRQVVPVIGMGRIVRVAAGTGRALSGLRNGSPMARFSRLVAASRPIGCKRASTAGTWPRSSCRSGCRPRLGRDRRPGLSRLGARRGQEGEAVRRQTGGAKRRIRVSSGTRVFIRAVLYSFRDSLGHICPFRNQLSRTTAKTEWIRAVSQKTAIGEWRRYGRQASTRRSRPTSLKAR